jgi:hypothetical protein
MKDSVLFVYNTLNWINCRNAPLYSIWQQLSNFNKQKKITMGYYYQLAFNTSNQLDVHLFHTATTHIAMLKYHCCHTMSQHYGTNIQSYVQIKCIKLCMFVKHRFVL